MVQRHITEKFGKAADPSRATGTSKASDEEIPLECTKKRVAVWDDDEIFWEESVDAIMGSNKKSSGSVWQRFRGGEQTSEPSGEAAGSPEDMARSTSGKYQPPSARRGAAGGPPMDAGADDSTLRVSNLGERVTDGDLQILFQTFRRTNSGRTAGLQGVRFCYNDKQKRRRTSSQRTQRPWTGSPRYVGRLG
jgi:hypothetical protein